MPESVPRRVGVVGSGLIGASIGLALRARGVEVLLRDRDPKQVEIAETMGAGRPWTGEHVDHAVVAVPPHAVAGELRALQQARMATTYSDVASVKARPLLEAVQAGCDLSSWCPAHPVAGRERGGAVSARPDLFADRTWVVCPVPHTSAAALADATWLARICGASPLRVTAERHDEVMAVLSHVPQVVASLLASATPALRSGEPALAGQGFRDVTRLADSDPVLWASILEGNRAPVAAVCRSLARDLAGLADTLGEGTADEVTATVLGLIGRGNEGRGLLPRKIGDAPARPWAWVGVVLADRPGQLGALFTAIGELRVNVEDVAPFEHRLETPAGTVELAVAPGDADRLSEWLAAAGWTAYRRA